MDHETSGAQEWHLPGYGRETAKKPLAASSPENLAPPTGPKAHGSKTSSPSRAVVAVREAPARGQAGARNRATNTRSAAAAQHSSLLRDSSAKAKWRNGSKPAGVVELPVAFGLFKHDFFGAARLSTSSKKTASEPGRNEVFEDISKRTGAFVKPPMYQDKHIQIWGEPYQFDIARQQIEAIIKICVNQSRVKAGSDWTKIKAHSLAKEENAEFKERSDGWLLDLRKAPDPALTYLETFMFLWPKDGPSMVDCLGPELEALDSVRVEFRCPVFVPKDMPGYICAVGNHHDSIKKIAGCIRVLWAEAVAKNSIKTKIYLVEPPKPSAMKAKINIKKENFHKPVLRGSLLKGEKLEEWKSRMELLQSKNNTRLLTAVENCLKGVPFVRGHLRMRVNLGTFILETYQRPEGDKTSYGFEEFRKVLLHEQSKGRLVPELKVGQHELLERCFEASDFLEPINKSTELKDADLAYSVNFEFLGADKSMLRLEAEFAKSAGAREYEIKERRWLRPRTGGQTRDQRPPLHVAVIDFGRSDWQLEIKSLEFHETSSIDAALKNFSGSIGFKHAENEGDISAKPKRRVTFPAEPPVSRVVEKSAIRYRIKGTNYIFEMARYDEYKRTQASIGNMGVMIPGGMAEIPFTTWGASVYGAEWDNLLGVHANLASGQSANYTPTLATFFPGKAAAPTADSQNEGFWKFINLVKKAADLVGPTRIPSMDTESVEKSTETPAANASSPANMLSADLGTLF